jgi:hypothetical protein
MRKIFTGTLIALSLVFLVTGCQQSGEIPEILKIDNRTPALGASEIVPNQTLSITFNFPIDFIKITKDNLFSEYLGYGPSHSAGEPTVTSISWSADYKTLTIAISGWSAITASSAKVSASQGNVEIVPKSGKMKDIFGNDTSATLWMFYVGEGSGPTSTTTTTITTTTTTGGPTTSTSTTTTSTTTTTILAGVNWTEVTQLTGFSTRAAHSSFVFDNKIWVIGGQMPGGRTNEVWSSLDGSSWTLVTGEAAFPPIQMHTSVVFNNKMWIIGGYADIPTITKTNEVWSSSNGRDWVSEGLAGFSPRNSHSSVVYDSKIWVIGGSVAGISPSHTNEVWSSTNGTSWVKETTTANFPPRWGHSSVVHDNKMWTIGGMYTDPGFFNDAYNDVWYSSNGITWQQATSEAGFVKREYHSSVSHQGKMWVIGGQFDDGMAVGIPFYDDVWYSSDGLTWTEATGEAGWDARSKHSSVVFNGKIWVIGGYYEDMFLTIYRYFNDVWYSP